MIFIWFLNDFFLRKKHNQEFFYTLVFMLNTTWETRGSSLDPMVSARSHHQMGYNQLSTTWIPNFIVV